MMYNLSFSLKASYLLLAIFIVFASSSTQLRANEDVNYPFTNSKNCHFKMGWFRWHPFTYSQNNLVTGLDIKIARAVFNTLGCKVSYHQMPWKRQLSALKSRQLDVIPGVYLSDERSQWATYSAAYRSEDTKIFTLRNSPFKDKIHSLQDVLAHKFKLTMILGGYLGQQHQQLMNNEDYKQLIFASPGYEHQLAMLQHGRVDGVLFESISAQYKLRKAGLETKVAPLSFNVYSGNVHFLFSRQVPKPIISAFNRQLFIFKQTTEYRELINAYLLAPPL